MSAEGRERDREVRTECCAVIRGNRGSLDHLRQIGELLDAGVAPRQHRWIVDDREAQDALPIYALKHFVRRAKRHRGVDKMAIAWVSSAPWSLSRQCIANRLPFRFRRFVHIDEAQRWLAESA